ncbi:hypothetical protein EYF80_024991 [Liparis tanakae]|uniref:Uncharacterized protein n=1 Tax=Liparis tanakae TaxID=230148 RepID=A0A4Z2HGE2_9TELE|nr:hypothetical protein EYF80_024991 [Liparis tanakae]
MSVWECCLDNDDEEEEEEAACCIPIGMNSSNRLPANRSAQTVPSPHLFLLHGVWFPVAAETLPPPLASSQHSAYSGGQLRVTETEVSGGGTFFHPSHILLYFLSQQLASPHPIENILKIWMNMKVDEFAELESGDVTLPAMKWPLREEQESVEAVRKEEGEPAKHKDPHHDRQHEAVAVALRGSSAPGRAATPGMKPRRGGSSEAGSSLTPPPFSVWSISSSSPCLGWWLPELWLLGLSVSNRSFLAKQVSDSEGCLSKPFLATNTVEERCLATL